MKKTRKLRFLTFLFSIFYFLFSVLYAAKIHPDAGSTSATFLKIGVGARPIAMGGAYCAISDDVFGLYWNPAGIIQLDKKQIAGMHNEWFQSIKSDYLGYVHPLNKKISIAGSVTGLYMKKDLERRSGLNEAIPEEPLTDLEGKFGAYDFAGSIGFAKRIWNNTAYGVMFKYIRQVIDVEKANGVAVDLGSLYHSTTLPLSFGLSVQNIGPKIKFIEKGYNLPLNFKTGCAYRLFNGDLTLALDVNQPIDNYAKFSLGAEYWIKKMLALRGGYTYRHNGNELGALSGVSGGVGMKIKDFGLDYAFVPFGDLGNTHRVSFSLKFGKQKPKETIKEKISFGPAIPLPQPPIPKPEIENKIKNIVITPVIISASQRIYKANLDFNDADIVGMEFLTNMSNSEGIKIGIEKSTTSFIPQFSGSGIPYLFFELKHNLPPLSLKIPKITVSLNKGISFKFYQLIGEKWEKIDLRIEKEMETSNLFSLEPKTLTKFAIVEVEADNRE
ncbi:MAG: hypothetical protein COS68_06605 [Elusimicrobia bacterium CG06_land_8_20_14_3_00_38_11]|nr:MAG: hypothetical protein COS68_06605 [Elusimicrobia bacterium CG06_land_8_20_14_3_00_38_11]